MKTISKKWPAAALLAVIALGMRSAFAQTQVGADYRWVTFAVFAAIIAITLYVTYLAAKRVRSASDFYTAGGGVSGFQNGWAVAGDLLLSGNRRPDIAVRLRRLHVLGRLSGRVHYGAAADRRALPQHRSLHARGHP